MVTSKNASVNAQWMLHTPLTYNSILKNAQATVYSILSGDSAITSQATVLDGVPQNLFKNYGQAYVIVSTPNFDETQETMSKKYVSIVFAIECYTSQESVLRQLMDLVRASLESNQATTKLAGMDHKHTANGSRSYVAGERTIYTGTLRVLYEWRG